jgi:hypothetical protein
MSGGAGRSNRKAQVLTIAILTLALSVALVRKGQWGRAVSRVTQAIPAAGTSAGVSPEDAIYDMLDAARAGDVVRYLASYSDAMAASLRQSFSGKPESDFARYLQESNSTVKGVTVMPPRWITDREAKVRVDYTYVDRTERQDLWLEKSGKSWKIARVGVAEQVKTAIPYGTPVRD